MHFLCEKRSSTNDNSKMTNVGIDYRLRRQIPVTAAKPPKLRLGFRAIAPTQPQTKRQPVQDISSRNAQEVLPIVNEGSMSCHGNKLSNAQTDSHGGNHQKVASSSKRPLIHHQRQNLKNRFHLLKTLGEGTYGKVKLAADKSSGEHVAIKYIKKTKIEDENDLNRIRREIQILSSLRHKHIVNIREVFERKDKIVLVLDYAQGGELYDYLNRMGKLLETEARRIFRQIVSAIYYCHQNGIVHRDLKLENIILDDQGNVKIADFGLSNYYSLNSKLKTFCGSPLYASPEIVNGKPYYGPEVDVWSLGVILYTLVYGSMPFESNNLVSLKQQISNGEYNQPSMLSDAAGLIRHMLTVTPSRRATMEDALHHWWINFGHTHMPNDIAYSPDDEPLSLQYSIVPDKSPQKSSLDPLAIIHHKNQSSISSDSDLELDIRPNRWSKRTISLDSTGNSVSSSLAGSPAPTPDSYKNFNEITSDDAAIASGLLKLPSDVLEILKGCSNKSLAALLNQDRLSPGFDVNRNMNSNSASGQINTEETLESASTDKVAPSVFDSERKPTRGILKRKGKFSGSGGMMSENAATKPADNVIPKSGHLPRRLPSFKDETHDIFLSKHRASQLIGHTSDSSYHTSSSATISHSAWSGSSHTSDSLYHPSSSATISHSAWSDSSSHLLRENQQHFQVTPENICSMQTSDSLYCSKITPIDNTLINPSSCLEADLSKQSTIVSQCKSKHECDIENSAKVSLRESTSESIPYLEPNRVIYRPKSILKKSSFDESKNRLSISSIGSNSSADILDLSYDSGDSDHFVNNGTEDSPRDYVKSDDGTAMVNKLKQRSNSFDETLIELKISEKSDLPFDGRQRSQSDQNELPQENSPLIRRITMNAVNL